MTRSNSHKFAERRARYLGKPVPAGLKHGTNSYARRIYGCGCAECVPSGKRTWKNRNHEDRPLTHAERQKKLRSNKRGKPVPPGTKHGTYAGRVYGCTCPICKAAKRRETARSANRWRSTAHGRWTTVGKSEMICWPPRDAGPDWVCPDPSHYNKEVA